MKGLIQRVSQASVSVEGDKVGAIETGILLLLGVERADTDSMIEKMLHKVMNYRIFPDAEGKMNLSLKDIQGGLLVVSQFTLAAETKKGLRPGFSSAAIPDVAEDMYNRFLKLAKDQHTGEVASGRFGTDMKVQLLNDGPVTFLLEI